MAYVQVILQLLVLYLEVVDLTVQVQSLRPSFKGSDLRVEVLFGALSKLDELLLYSLGVLLEHLDLCVLVPQLLLVNLGVPFERNQASVDHCRLTVLVVS